MTYTLKVSDIIVETKDSVTLCFKQPALRKIKYLSGQYLTLIFRINGRRYLRPYSFSSTPSVDQTMNVTIKRVTNGIVSNHIHDTVKIGDSIEVLAPMGNFIFDETSKSSDVFLWGVGSGITPLISIIKHILNTNNSLKVKLIYGNRNLEETLFVAIINQLLDAFPDSFSAFMFYTQSDGQAMLNQRPGRITKDHVYQIMEETQPISSLHYVCGPQEFKLSIVDVLMNLQVSPQNILIEDFEMVKDPKDFELIKTQNIVLQYNQCTFNLEVIKGKSVLESALEAGIELPYSCQTGDCSTCKAELTSGQLKMIGLKDARHDLQSNEYLLCCSYPIGNDVYIKV